ncbi:hypothetical protein J3459_006139 [Metarhizium acridum]|nr:hypothetical protein J3459_006139 [Metarhizium acridum]
MHKTNPLQTSKLLEAAAQSALNMPRLETMTIWNGAKGEACAFTWCRQGALISWRGTWGLKLEPSVLDAWKTVAFEYAHHELTVNTELLAHKIDSHGDAIQHLGLHSVVDDMSLRQLRKRIIAVSPALKHRKDALIGEEGSTLLTCYRDIYRGGCLVSMAMSMPRPCCDLGRTLAEGQPIVSHGAVACSRQLSAPVTA